MFRPVWVAVAMWMLALGCGGGGGTTPTVPATTPPVIASFTATPATLVQGAGATLSWSVTGATGLRLDPGGLDVTGTLRHVVNPAGTTAYTLTASGSGGTTSATVTVTVQSAGAVRTVPYASLPGVQPDLLSLDIHSVVGASNRPVLFYVHGGGWSQGDKSSVDLKPAAFSDQGFLFVSANYRLTTERVKFPVHVQDLAKALRWVKDHIATYGGDPTRIFLMGHSAGCQLVSLLATDGSYLQAEGLTLQDVKGVLALDTQAYDLVALAQGNGGVLPPLYSDTFGTDPALWPRFSATQRVAAGQGIPPFFVAYSGGVSGGGDPERTTISTAFYQKLQQSHVLAELEPAPELSHAQINQDFGNPADPVTRAAFGFLQRLLVPATAPYMTPTFSRVAVRSGLSYGQARTWDGRDQTLLLDLYEPQGDESPIRPAIVWIHGGGFVGGERTVAPMVTLATNFAKRGYVCVSIDYRLRTQAQVDADLAGAVRDAMHDAKAAVRWLRRYASLHRVDPTRIAIGGGSAGAFTALAEAYVPDEGDSGNPGYSASVQAVVDFWGGLLDPTQIGAGEAPVMIIHGTEDATVPFSMAQALRDRARVVALPHAFHPLIGKGHAAWDYLDDSETWIAPFLYRCLMANGRAGASTATGAPSAH